MAHNYIFEFLFFRLFLIRQKAFWALIDKLKILFYTFRPSKSPTLDIRRSSHSKSEELWVTFPVIQIMLAFEAIVLCKAWYLILIEISVFQELSILLIHFNYILLARYQLFISLTISSKIGFHLIVILQSIWANVWNIFKLCNLIQCLYVILACLSWKTKH